MHKFLRILIVGGIFFTFVHLAEGQTAVKLPKPNITPTHLVHSPQAGKQGSAAVSNVDMGPMPFSNEEANFYRRAWPIDESHSLGALILFGTVVVTLLILIVRQMAKSGPRKPTEK